MAFNFQQGNVTTPGNGNANAGFHFQDGQIVGTTDGQPPQSANENPSLGQGAFGEFSKGALKSVAEIGGNIEKGVASVVGSIPGVHVSPEATKTIADEGISGAGETTGYIAGTLAPYFIPGGAGTLPVKAAPLLAKLAETLGVKAESFIPRAAEYIIKNLPDFGKNVAIGTAQSGNLGEGLATGGSIEALKGLGIGAKMLKNYAVPTPTVNQIIGQVAQGSSKDIPSFGKGLANLDTSNVKTYNDLYKLSNSEIKKLAAQQDALLGQDKTLYKVQQLATPIKTGESSIAHNYVLDSVKQLKAFYAKTNDVAGVRKMEVYESRLNPKNGQGLTLQEVNDIARLHGSDLNAFNANGELASGLTKQAAENTRKGLKNTVRNLLPNDESKTLDSQMSDIYTVRDLSEKMAEKVNTLQQRLQNPSILQKLGGIIGKGLRFTGIGDFASSLLGIEKVPGAKTLNPVELEARLAKNLKRIDAALQKDDAGFLQDIKAMDQESESQKAAQPMSESTSNEPIKSAMDNIKNPKAGFVNFGADVLGKDPEAALAKQNKAAVGPLENSRFLDEQNPETFVGAQKNIESSVHDWDKPIERGAIPKDKIFNKDGTFTPAAARHVVDDMSLKMNRYQKGLGTSFKPDMSNATPESLVAEAKQHIQAASNVMP